MAKVRQETFNGRCAEPGCGDVADARDVAGTALIQHQKTQVYSAMGTQIVRCMSGHAYYILKRDTEVLDPFGGDTPEPDLELPPPPQEDD